LWSFVRYNFDLTWEEFEELTPSMLQALCRQRNIRIKYERYAHALTTSAIYNVNRKPDSPVIRPFDFVMTEEQADKRDTKLNALRLITEQIAAIPAKQPRSKFLEVRRRVIDTLLANGIGNAEQMFDEKWPSLKPKENEQ
jgi:hypothetical protein